MAFTVFIIIMTQSYWELSYNKKVNNYKQIYRLISHFDEKSSLNISRPHGDAIGNSSSAIKSFTPVMVVNGNQLIQTQKIERQVKETFTFVTRTLPAITEVLSLECLFGDFKQFEEPKTAIISKSVSGILFPDNDPIGKIIIIPDWKDTLQVVAVYKDLPKNCSFNNGIFKNLGNQCVNDWSEWSFIYYYRLNSQNAKLDVEKQANKLIKEIAKESGQELIEEKEYVSLEPFSDLYYSKAENGYQEYPTGNRATTNLLTTIAIVIFFIAIINYINFFMALVPIRIRSVNINKVFGVPTSALRLNFIGESIGLLLLSFILSLLLVLYLSGTFIGDLIDAPLKIKENLLVVTMTGIFIIITGILAGLFPALYITKYGPAFVLKGAFGRSKQGQIFRSILIIFQFTTSIALIIGVWFVYLQSIYMQKYDYGFNRDHLAIAWVGNKIASQPHTFASELRKNPNILEVAFANDLIIDINMKWGKYVNGELIMFSCMPVSWNFPELMDFKLKVGRFFNEDDATKAGGTFIFNEAAIKKLGINVGDYMNGHSDEESAEIIGVVKDFNFTSLQKEIEPFALYEFGCYGWQNPSIAYIRLRSTDDFKQTSNFIATVIQMLDPDFEIDYIQVVPFERAIKYLYTKELNLTKLISLFSIVTIIISLMGVFGIVVFENQHRKKEIALRKIHGATTELILGMFNRKFIIILLISFVIAAPVAYFSVTKWLSGFAYRAPVYWWVFVGSFLIVASITLLTVSLQTFRAANENPINSLKTE
jgi:putative ABC transport system permease protein